MEKSDSNIKNEQVNKINGYEENNNSLINRVGRVVDASLGRRVMAFFLDGLILIIPIAIASTLIPVVGGFLVWLLYGPVLESSDLRATIGKYWMGIEVVDDQGRKISFKASLLRNLLKFVSTGLFMLGFFVALFSKRKQTLHDILTETYVVYGRNELSFGDVWVKTIKEIWNGLPNNPKNDFSFPAASESCSKTEDHYTGTSRLVSELERLSALRANGSLTEEEFNLAKSKVIQTAKG